MNNNYAMNYYHDGVVIVSNGYNIIKTGSEWRVLGPTHEIFSGTFELPKKIKKKEEQSPLCSIGVKLWSGYSIRWLKE